MAELQACYRALLAGEPPSRGALARALQQEQGPRVGLAWDLPEGLSLLHAAVLGRANAIPALLAAGAEVRSLGRDLRAPGRALAAQGLNCRRRRRSASPSPSDLPQPDLELTIPNPLEAKRFLLSLAEGQPWPLAERLLEAVGATAAEAVEALDTCRGPRPTAAALAARWQPCVGLARWWRHAAIQHTSPLHLALRLLDERSLQLLLHASPQPAAEVAETAGHLLQLLCRDEAGDFATHPGSSRLAEAAAVLLGAGAHPADALDALRHHGSRPPRPQAELRAALLNGACLLLELQQDRRAAAAAGLAEAEHEREQRWRVLRLGSRPERLSDGNIAAMQAALAQHKAVERRVQGAREAVAAAAEDVWTAAQMEMALGAAAAAADERALNCLFPAYAAASRREGCELDEELLAQALESRDSAVAAAAAAAAPQAVMQRWLRELARPSAPICLDLRCRKVLLLLGGGAVLERAMVEPGGPQAFGDANISRCACWASLL